MKQNKIIKLLFIASIIFTILLLCSCDGSGCKHKNMSIEVVDPTHNACGYTKHFCNDCDYSYMEQFTDPLPHDYKKTITASSCTKEGEILYKCDCGDSYIQIIDPLGHSYQENVTPPTCTLGGSTRYTCKRCKDSYVSELTDATGHTLTSTVIDPTCTSEGYTHNECVCGYSYDDKYIKPLEHTFVETVTSPTCTAQGYTTFTCDCGYSFNDKYTQPVDHSLIEVVTPPSCTAEGFTTYTCECGYSFKFNYTEPIPHTYTDSVIAPTCTTQGYTTHTCECGYSYIDSFVSPIPHNMTQTVTSPTCTEQGYTTNTCECGYSFVDSYVEPTGHDFTSEEIAEASCDTVGETLYTCACGESYSVITEPFGHKYTKTITMPTLSDMGNTVYYCETCGHTYTGDLRFYSDIVPNAYAESSEVLSKGIDISYHNYKQDVEGNYLSLDWESIKKAGITYVIIRIADTSIGIDPTFEKSYTEAKAAGLDVGFYLYTRATNVAEATLEAKFVLSALEGKQFEYPVYLDLEDESLINLSAPVLNQMCVTFFTALQRAGYYTGLYVNAEWLKNVIDTEAALSRFDIWYAHHINLSDGDQAEWDEESYGKALGMWQYSGVGIIEGCDDTKFDLNYCYKDYPSIIKEYGFNGYESDFKFVGSDKSFVWVIHSPAIKVRTKPDYFTTDGYDPELDVIGYADYGSYFEVVEITENYTKIKYGEEIAYISSKPEYVSYEGIYVK